MAETENNGQGIFPCDDPEGLALSGDTLRFYNAFHKFMRAHFKVLQNLMSNEDVPPAQLRCLFFMQSKEGVFQRELAQEMHIERATATVMLQKMERKGFIERRPDENDQRLTRIYLTDFGRKKAQEINGRLAEVLNEGMSCVSEQEQQQLTGVLDRIADRFRDIQQRESNAKGGTNL